MMDKSSESSTTKHYSYTISITSILPIITPIMLVILLVTIIILIVLLHRHKLKKLDIFSPNDGSNIDSGCEFVDHTIINFSESPGGTSRLIIQCRVKGVQVFTYQELEMATDSFSEANVLGHGGYGKVYRGVLSDGTLAAIKLVHRDGKQSERAFKMELLGYCADQNHRLLIFEYMPNGSLQEHLHSPHIHPRSLDWGTRLRIALDCARALEFLHEHVTPSIIHRDFKCSNILLDKNYRAKVSDLGSAKTGSNKINGQISTRVVGTTGYLSPEYASTGKITTKSDVFSCGVVLLQLITGRVPVDSRRPPGEHALVSWALPRLTHREKVMEMVDPTIKGQYSPKDMIQIAAVAAVCLQSEPDYRPLMTDVVQSLIPLVKSTSSNPLATSGFLANMVGPSSERHSFS